MPAMFDYRRVLGEQDCKMCMKFDTFWVAVALYLWLPSQILSDM